MKPWEWLASGLLFGRYILGAYILVLLCTGTFYDNLLNGQSHYFMVVSMVTKSHLSLFTGFLHVVLCV